jgi:uncharacterized membrane protein YjjP (DUF1212 family)
LNDQYYIILDYNNSTTLNDILEKSNKFNKMKYILDFGILAVCINLYFNKDKFIG